MQGFQGEGARNGEVSEMSECDGKQDPIRKRGATGLNWRLGQCCSVGQGLRHIPWGPDGRGPISFVFINKAKILFQEVRILLPVVYSPDHPARTSTGGQNPPSWNLWVAPHTAWPSVVARIPQVLSLTKVA